MKAILNTGRTIPQGVSVEHKVTAAYHAAVTVCYINPVDLMNLGIDDGDRVALTSPVGRIVLTAQSSEGTKRGEVFVPLGPYANHIITAETHATGMPDFKGEYIEVSPTSEPVKDIGGVMEEIGGVRYDH